MSVPKNEQYHVKLAANILGDKDSAVAIARWLRAQAYFIEENYRQIAKKYRASYRDGIPSYDSIPNRVVAVRGKLHK